MRQQVDNTAVAAGPGGPAPVAVPPGSVSPGSVSPGSVPPVAASARWRSPVGVAHAATLVVSFAYWAWLDRHLWFYGDEWDFLARRGVLRAQVSLWVPHNEHWSTLPILLWRAIFSVVHLSSYWPYLLPLLLAHVGVVHLVWRRCRRDGVGPWVATAVALFLGLLGTAWEDLAWAFQIGWVGALLLGLAALDIADRRRTDRRADLVVSLLAVAAMMCSSVGDATTVALAVALLAGRAWGRAVRILALPVLAYGLWWTEVGRRGLAAMGDTVTAPVVTGIPVFVWKQFANALGSGRIRFGEVVTGLLALWALRHLGALRRHRPATLGLLAGAVAFYALTALGRDRLGQVIPSRYAYVGVVLALPAAAAALSAVAARRVGRAPRWMAAVAVVAVVAGLTADNAERGVGWVAARVATTRADRAQILGSAELLSAGQRAINPYPFPGSGRYGGHLTPADLVRLDRDGVLPAAGTLTPAQVRADLTWLDVDLTPAPTVAGPLRLTGAARVVSVPTGPDCTLFRPRPTAGRLPPVLRLGLAAGSSSGSVEVRARTGATLVASLVPARSGVWPPHAALPPGAELLVVAPGGTGRINDAAPGDALEVQLPRRGVTEICGLRRPVGIRPT